MKKLLIVLLVTGVLGAYAGNETKLMFGSKDTPKESSSIAGFQLATPASPIFVKKNDSKNTPWLYNPRGGACHGKSGAAGTEPADQMLEHGIVCNNSTLLLEAPNGKNFIKLWVGDWFQGIRRFTFYKRAISITVNGKRGVYTELTPEVVFRDYWCRGENYLFSKKDNIWDRIVKPILDEYTFEVDVTDGKIKLDLDNVLLTALAVTQDRTAMDALSAKLEKERRQEFAKRYPWKPQPDEAMPAPDSKSQARGFIVFQKYGDDRVFPWSRPAVAEIRDTIRVFAAKGEQETLRFGIIPLRELKNFDIKIGDFVSKSGSKISTATNADFWRERYKGRGSAGTRGKFTDIRKLDPESYVFQAMKTRTYEAETPRMFTLDVRVPSDSESGDYFAPVTFIENGKSVSTAKLQLKVLPFALNYKDAAAYNFQAGYLNFGDSTYIATKAFLKEQIAKRVKFIAKYHFSNGFQQFWGWRMPSILKLGNIVGKPGERHFTQTPEQAAIIDWWFKLLKNEGNTDFVMLTPRFVFLNLGWNIGLGKHHCYFGQPTDTPEKLAIMRKDIFRIIKQFNEYGKKNGYPEFRWYPTGEMDNYGIGGVKESIEFAKLIKEAGGITFTTINGPLAAKYCPKYFDYLSANHATPINQKLIDDVHKYGHNFGSHNSGDTRFQAGWHFWRMHGFAKYQETNFYIDFLLPFSLLPWNYNTAQVYPAPDCTYRPTLHFLNYRDGRDDYLYMHMLEALIKQAKSQGLEKTPACLRAQKFTNTMTNKIYLDARMYQVAEIDPKEGTLPIKTSEWNPTSFERYRWQVASLIMDLQKTIGEK